MVLGCHIRVQMEVRRLTGGRHGHCSAALALSGTLSIGALKPSNRGHRLELTLSSDNVKCKDHRPRYVGHVCVENRALNCCNGRFIYSGIDFRPFQPNVYAQKRAERCDGALAGARIGAERCTVRNGARLRRLL